MTWKKMLAYISGSVDDMLLKKVEYLLEENKVLQRQLEKRPQLTNMERISLAGKAIALGALMADTVTIVKPATILKWHWFRRVGHPVYNVCFFRNLMLVSKSSLVHAAL